MILEHIKIYLIDRAKSSLTKFVAKAEVIRSGQKTLVAKNRKVALIILLCKLNICSVLSACPYNFGLLGDCLDFS